MTGEELYHIWQQALNDCDIGCDPWDPEQEKEWNRFAELIEQREKGNV